MKLVILTIILLYLLLCAGYASLLAMKSASLERGIYSFVIGAAFPVVGFIYLWICDYYSEKAVKKDFSEFYTTGAYTRESTTMFRTPDRVEEINQVPMEEALSFNSFEYRRNAIMKLLNESDTLQYLDILREALENEDTETSHYASTVIMEMQRKVQEELIEREALFAHDPEDLENLRKWEALLYRVVNSTLYDEQNTRRYILKYDLVSDRLIQRIPEEEVYYYHRIQILFRKGDYTNAAVWCDRYLEAFEESEDAVECRLLLHIQTRDSDGMVRFLETLGERPVLLTQKTLEYIRTFKRQDKWKSTIKDLSL